jgi:hypothetical protein
MASLKNTTINDTGNITLPNGTTAQRPSPVNGMTRYNTDNSTVELYNGATSTWNQITDATYNAELLLVAGGGGGGAGQAYFYGGGGGGGGGGVIYVASTAITKNTSYSITIGAGGEGGRISNNYDTSATLATQGVNTTGFGYTAIGGGAGQSYTQSSSLSILNGGSGGGGARDNNTNRGTGTSGQGNAGGFGGGTSCASAGGGGGAGEAGKNGCGDCNATRSPADCANGGVGVAYNWTGTNVYYGGGGGGAYEGSNTAAQQPLGGNGIGNSGGNGSAGLNPGPPSRQGSPGAIGSGNGGGGGYSTNGLTGGSGILMIRYSGTPLGEGGTIVVSGGFTTHIFYGSGTYKG